MLKMVPDPPHPQILLEDILVRATEHVLCALAVAHQSVLLTTRSPGSMLTLAAVHEMENVRTLLESALAQVQFAAQMPDRPQTLH